MADDPVDPVARLAALPGVGAAAAAARDAIDAVVSERGRRRVGSDVVAAALLRGALGSALCDEPDHQDEDPVAPVLDRIEHLRSSVEDSDEASADEALPVRARALAAAYTELPALAAGTAVTPVQAWTRLHERLSLGWLVDAARGRLRVAGEAVEDSGGGSRPDAPDGSVAWRRVRDLATTVASGTRAPAVVLAALVHAELATVRPFVAGNDALARAAERLVLMSTGVDPTGLAVPEVAYAEAGAARTEALAAYASGSGSGTAAWLRFACAAYARGAELSPAGRAGVAPPSSSSSPSASDSA